MRWLRGQAIRSRIAIWSVIIAIVFIAIAGLGFRAAVDTIVASSTHTLLGSDGASYEALVLREKTSDLPKPAEGQNIALVDPDGTVRVDNLPASLGKKLDTVLAFPKGVHVVTTSSGIEYDVSNEVIETKAGFWHIVEARNRAEVNVVLGGLDAVLLGGGVALVIGFGVASWIVTGLALRPVSRLRHQASLLVEMDADGSHQPEQLPRLLDEATRSDVVLGSRWVAGGGAPGWALRRAILSRAGSAYARIALGLGGRDATGGYRVFRRSALVGIDYASVEAQGCCFQIEMLWRVVRAGLTVREVPIAFARRTSGVSKMSGDIVAEAIARVTVWGILGLPERMRRARPGIVASDEITSSRTPLHGGIVAAHGLDGRD